MGTQYWSKGSYLGTDNVKLKAFLSITISSEGLWDISSSLPFLKCTGGDAGPVFHSGNEYDLVIIRGRDFTGVPSGMRTQVSSKRTVGDVGEKGSILWTNTSHSIVWRE